MKITTFLGNLAAFETDARIFIFELNKIIFSDLCKYVFNWLEGKKHTHEPTLLTLVSSCLR
jgi:hypothetical protein